MSNFNATSGTDTITGTSGADTVTYSNANQINSTDFVDLGAGTDGIVISSGISANFSVYGTDATHGFHNIEALTFTTSSAASTTFDAAQFGAGLVSTSLAVTGNNSAVQSIFITNATNFSAAGWTFSTWVSGSDVLTITGTGGADTITGSSQADTITGGAGADTISAGAGNDTINLANGDFAAGESIDGGTGTDTIVLTNATTVDLTTGTIANVENLTGSSGNDVVTMSSALFDTLSSIDLGGGTDTLNIAVSGTTNLTAVTNPGTLSAETIGLVGSSGNDAVTISGTQFNTLFDAVDLGDGTDSLTVALGSGTTDLSSGTAPTINPDTETVALTATSSNDTVTLSAAQFADFTSIDLGSGTDTLNVLASGTVNISGGSNPTIAGTETKNLTGSGGADTITLTGAQLNNFGSVNLGSGTDTINLTSTSTVLNALGDSALSGVEAISGANAAGITITLSSQSEAFTLTGSASADAITGGSNADTITGGAGADTLSGGGGNDTFNLANGDFAAGESIDGGANTDTIVLTNATTVDFSTGTIANVENLTGSSGNDDVTMTSALFDALSSINLGSGTDTLNIAVAGTISLTGVTNPGTLSGVETFGLVGSAGNDAVTISGTQFNTFFDAVDLGSGTDSLTVALGSGTTDLSAGTAPTIANTETVALTASSLTDTVTLSAAQFADFTSIDLGVGTDTLNVLASGTVNISGGNAPTITNTETRNLTGSAGNDVITMSGAQLNDFTSVNLGGGTNTINLTTTSTGLNALTDGSLQNVDVISASTAGTGVTIDLHLQSDGFTITGGGSADIITGSSAADIITGGTGADTISAGAGNDTINLANGDFAVGESIDGGANTDAIVLTNATTVDFSTGTIANVENLTGSTGADTVTVSAQQFAALSAIDLSSDTGGNDTLNIEAIGTVDISGVAGASITNVEIGNLTGSSGDDSITLTGTQLNNILTSGVVALGGGNDTIDLKTTSSELNALVDGSLTGVENFSTVGATSAVTLTLTNQTEGFTITSGAQGDTLTGGSGADTFVMNVDNVRDILDGKTGTDTVNYSAYSAALTVTLNGATAVTVTGTGSTAANSDTIANIENFVGGSAGDTITGDTLANVIAGGGGNDIIHGGGGTDTAAFTGNRADYTVTYNSGGGFFTVVDHIGGRDGTDTVYVDVEKLQFADQTDTICFMAGTMIQTPRGEVAVEMLKRGDLVLTADGRTIPVTWLGRQTVSTVFADPLRVLPIRITAGALGANVPARDLLVSPDHALLVGEVLVHAGALVNGMTIVRETKVAETFVYYHVEVDDHSLVLAENTPAETFIDNVDRLAFDNWDEHEALYPQGRAIVEMPYPRAKAARQVPRVIRSMLQSRAIAVGGSDIASAA